MYRQTNYETVNMMLRNPNLRNEGVMNETLQRFKKSNPYSDRDFSMLDVEEIIKNYLLTLSDDIKRKETVSKGKKNKHNLPDVNSPFVSGI